MTPALRIAVAALAVWRVTHLLQAEDGPFDLSLRLRRRAGDGWLGRLLDCFYCTSVWVAVPAAFYTGSGWLDRAALVLALSGAANLLERLTPRPEVVPAPYIEESEHAHAGLLWTRSKPADELTDPAGKAS